MITRLSLIRLLPRSQPTINRSTQLNTQIDTWCKYGEKEINDDDPPLSATFLYQFQSVCDHVALSSSSSTTRSPHARHRIWLMKIKWWKYMCGIINTRLTGNKKKKTEEFNWYARSRCCRWYPQHEEWKLAAFLVLSYTVSNYTIATKCEWRCDVGNNTTKKT